MVFITSYVERQVVRWIPFAARWTVNLQIQYAANGIQRFRALRSRGLDALRLVLAQMFIKSR